MSCTIHADILWSSGCIWVETLHRSWSLLTGHHANTKSSRIGIWHASPHWMYLHCLYMSGLTAGCPLFSAWYIYIKYRIAHTLNALTHVLYMSTCEIRFFIEQISSFSVQLLLLWQHQNDFFIPHSSALLSFFYPSSDIFAHTSETDHFIIIFIHGLLPLIWWIDRCSGVFLSWFHITYFNHSIILYSHSP